MRVLTYLKIKPDCNLQLAPFGNCLVTSFQDSKTVHEVQVDCQLTPKGLALSQPGSIVLRHPPFCPMLHLDPKQKATYDSNAGVSVAVAVILETSDTKVLITRRPPHMRTFPNVWVPPGGGSEESESLIETGLREVREETGLDIKNLMQFAEPLCLWESVYPPLLAKGQPKRHQIVLYLHALVHKSSQELDIKLDPMETDACAWLNLEQINLAVNYELELNPDHKLKVWELKKDDLQLHETFKSYDLLRADVPNTGSFDVERISTGTRFALEQFFKKKKTSSNM